MLIIFFEKYTPLTTGGMGGIFSEQQRCELDVAYDLQQEADKNANLLEKLYANDVIDEEGNLKNLNNSQDEN